MLNEYRGTRIENRDMQRQNVIRTILFVFFFSIGAATVGGSILCNDLVQYYRDKQLLKTAQQYLEKLRSLNTDYDRLLNRLEKDPNLVKRLAIATLGTKPEDANTIYPKATIEQLIAARKALENISQDQNEPKMPRWLTRCSDPHRRVVLFLAGAGLVLVSFICFAPAAEKTGE
jgi:cell division protein FtsB